MIGDTIATQDHNTIVGDLPDHASHIVTLTKVNQDGYAAEYRYTGATYDHLLLIRNSVEAPQKSGITFNRHNFEYRGTLRAVAPAISFPYVVGFTLRMPRGGDIAVMKAMAGNMAYRCFIDSTQSVVGKMLNFES